MSVRFEMAEGWIVELHKAETAFLTTQLGPHILDDARRYVPIDTGRLQASLDFDVSEDEGDGLPELHVGSYPDADGPVPYALAVEFGFHGEEVVRAQERVSTRGKPYTIREHTRHGNSPEQPYLRPALYQERYQ